jgi:hypothetical protein
MAAIKIPSSNLFFLGICAMGLLAFAMVGIFPNMKAARQLDDEIAQLSQKVQVQELLFPIYAELIKQFQQKEPVDLPLPSKSKIAKNEISELNAQFIELAHASNVIFENAITDPISYQEDSGHVTMNVAFSGDFFNFRTLLMNVCKLPYLNSIEHMEVVVQGKDKRIMMKLRLEQE